MDTVQIQIRVVESEETEEIKSEKSMKHYNFLLYNLKEEIMLIILKI